MFNKFHSLFFFYTICNIYLTIRQQIYENNQLQIMDKLQCKENRDKHRAILDSKRGPPKKKKTHESNKAPLLRKKKQDSTQNQQNQERINKLH